MRPKKKHASTATTSSDLMVMVEKKKSTRRRSSNGVDLISELPDPIIHHIFSYLDNMTNVIQTSLLSKRWRYLWTTLPFLNFDSSSCSTFRRREDLLVFVDHVLIFRNQNSNIYSFRFSYDQFHDRNILNHISTWIHILIRSNVQVIDLQFDSAELEFHLLELPMSLFTCKSLTVLKLDFGGDYNIEPCLGFKIPTSASRICLPALETLHLESLSLMDSFQFLISRCPVLETLIINYCFLDSKELNICNTQIKSLVIERMFKVNKSRLHEPCEIKVFAPKMMSFSCTDYSDYINHYSFVNVSSLVNAEIDIELDTDDSDFMVTSDVYRTVTRKNAIDCLRGICNVRSLMLSTWLLEIVTEVPDRLESLQINPFCNLSYLKLKTSFSKTQIAAITYLLEKCPNLEYLVLKVTDVSFNENKEKVECWEAELAPQCMMHHLKLIEIWDVEASVNELEFLRFLLNNALVLEKMKVLTSKQQLGNNCKRFRGFRKKLISFRGASSSSEIVFV